MSNPSDYKRVKHHHTCGDIPKSDKIHMREKHERQNGERGGVRGWLRMIYAKTRAVLKRRTEKEIETELEQDND